MKDQVFSVGYRRLPAGLARRWAPWAIARTALVLAWRKRSTKVGAALCLLSFFGHGMTLVGQILSDRFLSQVPGGGSGGGMMKHMVRGIVGEVHNTLATFIGVQMLACALLLAMVAGGLIAEDRRTGAMELYFSRPLSRLDYLVGKTLAAGLLPLGTLVIPFVLLWVLAVGMSPPDLAWEMFGLLVPGLLGAIATAAVLTATNLGLSALGARGRTVGVIYFVGLTLLSMAGGDLPRAGVVWAGYLSPLRDVRTVVDWALDAGGGGLLLSTIAQRPDPNASVLLSALALLGFVVAGFGVLWWRVDREVAG